MRPSDVAAAVDATAGLTPEAGSEHGTTLANATIMHGPGTGVGPGTGLGVGPGTGGTAVIQEVLGVQGIEQVVATDDAGTVPGAVTAGGTYIAPGDVMPIEEVGLVSGNIPGEGSSCGSFKLW